MTAQNLIPRWLKLKQTFSYLLHSLAIKPCSSDFVLLELLTTVNIFPIHLAHTISKTVFEVYLRV